MGEDHRLQKRVAGQPVGAVKAGAGDLPAGEQALDGCFPAGVDRNPSAQVVGRRDDGDRVLRDVDSVFQALAVDVGKPPDDRIAVLVADVQQNIIVP